MTVPVSADGFETVPADKQSRALKPSKRRSVAPAGAWKSISSTLVGHDEFAAQHQHMTGASTARPPSRDMSSRLPGRGPVRTCRTAPGLRRRAPGTARASRPRPLPRHWRRGPARCRRFGRVGAVHRSSQGTSPRAIGSRRPGHPARRCPPRRAPPPQSCSVHIGPVGMGSRRTGPPATAGSKSPCASTASAPCTATPLTGPSCTSTGFDEHAAPAAESGRQQENSRHRVTDSNISRMRAAGIAADVVAAWHGHTERMTQAVYGRVTDDRLTAAADVFSSAVGQI